MSLRTWGLLIFSGICFIVLMTLLISGWFARNAVAGAFIAALLLFMVLGTLAAGMFYLGAAWTERQVKLGAQIAATAQQIDNHADERRMAALAHFGRQMIQTTAKLPPQPAPYQLPPPLSEADATHWLPPLTLSNRHFDEDS